jgi:Bacterial protein of unknown function (DUF922)
MGGIKQDLLGTETGPTSGTSDEPLAPDIGAEMPGPIGLDTRRRRVVVRRIIATVGKDWEPPNPTTTPEITVRGATLADAANELNALPEWGQGGGQLRADPIPAGTSTDIHVNLHGNLVRRLPQWTGYDRASSAARAEWDRMMEKLGAHEDRHMAIAVEEADQLAADLVGREISEIAAMVTAANRRMKRRQDQLDADTEHGAKTGVQYGDVTLDVSID